MRVYADSSFILRLLTGEADSPETVSEYRRLGNPRLFFLPLHDLEVHTAIRQRAFQARRSLPSNDRAQVARDRDAALARLARLIGRRTLVRTDSDMEAALVRATALSESHAERVGARSIDLLHVACALSLESELFLTNDVRQAGIAKAESLKVMLVA